MSLRLLALAGLFALPGFAQSVPSAAPSAASSSSAALIEQCILNVARNGNEVVLSWKLPDADIKQFEIFRNTREQAIGRGRVAAVRIEPAIYYDSVPEPELTYWYWLKITFGSGHVINVGPVTTPAAKVWTP